MIIITILAVVIIIGVTISYSIPLLRLKSFAKTIERSKDLSDLSQESEKLSGLCSDYDITRTIEKDGEKDQTLDALLAQKSQLAEATLFPTVRIEVNSEELFNKLFV